METVPDFTKPTDTAAAGRTQAAAALQVKLSPRGFAIEHPDAELGEQRMAEALGSPIGMRCMACSGNW